MLRAITAAECAKWVITLKPSLRIQSDLSHIELKDSDPLDLF